MNAFGEFTLIEASGLGKQVFAGTITAKASSDLLHTGWVDFKDGTEAGQAARACLAEMLLPWSLTWLSLVHGVDVAVFDQLPEAATKTVADAAILTRPGTAVAFTTADCVPILINSKSAALAIHAGWRSLAGGIIEKAVGMLLEYEIEKAQFEAGGGSSDSSCDSCDIRTSDSALAGLRVWVGPAIDQANYEIDDATSSQLLSRPAIAKSAESCLLQNRPGHWLADLPKMAELILRDMGIAENHITQSQLSTYNEATLHSARRDGEDSGRMANFVVLLPSEQ